MTNANGSMREALRVQPGTVNLAGYEPDATPLAPGGRGKTGEAAAAAGPILAGLQERLWAERTRSVLLVLQGIDTAGKGGVVTHVVGLLGPEGVRVTAFKKPTPEEAAHHFLWRIRRALPGPGIVGVFDRSHYEDVLVPRVHETTPEQEWRDRYGEINAFEAELVGTGTAVVKCFLHISYAEQRERLLARLSDPSKHWKFQESDIDERAYWADYQAAFAGMLERCSTEAAPWYVVPSDRKWYRNWAVGRILSEVLEELDPRYPQTELDVERLRKRLQPPY
ncbi:MAG TPA: PPK2 family polyphosphate kinase [Jatrophihabitantaceae bacterium]|jgi:PPK2 family polyphosphate:nucleotide phosphotransferase|nr:PPK2 family polyphosphate kinase [Jatrophihabitantaceae bacterium]